MGDELNAFIEMNANTESDIERSSYITADITDLKRERMGDKDDPPEILVKHAWSMWCFVWTIYTTNNE